MQQGRNDFDQCGSIWDTKYRSMASESYAGLLLDICFRELYLKFRHVPDYLVDSVSKQWQCWLNNSTKLCKDVSNPHNDTHMDFSCLPSPFGCTVRCKSYSIVARCCCSCSHKFSYHSPRGRYRPRHRIPRESNDIQCFHLPPHDAKITSRNQSSGDGKSSTQG